jgi:hypothetical protein
MLCIALCPRVNRLLSCEGLVHLYLVAFAMKKPLSSTSVGEYLALKVRIDKDPVIGGRATSIKRRTSDYDRAIRGLGSKLTSTNTIIR